MNHLITITIKGQMVPDAIPVEGLLDIGITKGNDIQEHPNIIKESYELPNSEMLHNHHIQSTHQNKGCDTSPTSTNAMSCINRMSGDEGECCEDWIRWQQECKNYHKVFVL